MELFFEGHTLRYAVEQMLLTLYPGERPVYPERPDGALPCARISLKEGTKYVTSVCRLETERGVFYGRAAVLRAARTDAVVEKRLHSQAVKLALYRAALASGLPKPVWGALGGVRPAKLMARLLDEGLSPRAACTRFRADYDVSPGKARLCLDAALAGRAAADSLQPRDVCLYVGIPFCPTRCAYCSFVSSAVGRSAGLTEPFLQALFQEIDATAAAVRESGLRPVALYVGGGTPTTLSAAQLDALCRRTAAAFDLSALREYTVEAGRPDTITEEKLRVLHGHGVDRLSVNPQTMRDDILQAIGRRHTAADVERAMEAAARVGGFTVNMDLIAGLPGDDAAGFAGTLERVMAFAPANITVHTLCLKKGARLMTEETRLPPAETVGQMLEQTETALRGAQYAPYYLYRQKYMSGGFENVGWARGNTQNLYNICIMEELCTILAMGGGASTKLTAPTGRIVRAFAPKYPQEYIERIADTCAEKAKIKEFYDGKDGL